MKILLVVAMLLTTISAFAGEELRLPLASGGIVSFSGEIPAQGSVTLSSRENRNVVAEATSQAGLTVIDLYEKNENGILKTQFSLRNGLAEQVTEQKDSEGETVGFYVNRPLSEDGRAVLGLNSASLFGKDPGESPDERDRRLGPWLDLKGGGIATGPVNTVTKKKPGGAEQKTFGALLTGSALPPSGEGFKRSGREMHNWGTGMMVSLIENSSREFARRHPGTLVHVGGISRQSGGFFPPHKSHQNGLDADIPFMGTDGFDSQVGKDGKVKESFETEKNWDFFRLLMSQRIHDEGKDLSAVSMILVGPAIKKHYCEWAKNLKSPIDQEILRKMRPTEGHDDHIHLRLRCSPHHPLCLRQNYEPQSTGCE